MSSSSLLLGAMDSQPVQVQTQSEQMRDAMVLKAMTGTEWRVFEDRSSAMGGKQQDCASTVVFRGFVDGRWVTKPSEIRWGLESQVWRRKFSHKGFIRALPTVGKNGAMHKPR